MASNFDLGTIFGQLQAVGVYDYLLPFLLIFTLIFAILEKTRLLGTEGGGDRPKTNINTVIALIIGLIVVVQTPIVQTINNYLSKMALFIIIVLIFLLVIGVFGASTETGFSGVPLTIATVVSIIAVIWALSPDIGITDFWGRFLPNDTDRAFIFLIVIFFLVIYFVTRPARTSQGESILKKIGDELAKGKGH